MAVFPGTSQATLPAPWHMPSASRRVPRKPVHSKLRDAFLHRFRQLSGIAIEDQGVALLQASRARGVRAAARAWQQASVGAATGQPSVWRAVLWFCSNKVGAGNGVPQAHGSTVPLPGTCAQGL